MSLLGRLQPWRLKRDVSDADVHTDVLVKEQLQGEVERNGKAMRRVDAVLREFHRIDRMIASER